MMRFKLSGMRFKQAGAVAAALCLALSGPLSALAQIQGAICPNGAVCFQTDSFFKDSTYFPGDASAYANVLYPVLPARERVSIVDKERRNHDPNTNNQLNAPKLRLRSWLGGMLWGTGQTEPDYWTPDLSDFSPARKWRQETLPQNCVYTESIIMGYEGPNGGPSGAGAQAADKQGVALQGIYPLLKPAPDYAVEAGEKDAYWRSHRPLALEAGYFGPSDLMIQTTESAPFPPGSGGEPAKPAYTPVNLLVDRMGDIDVDLVYQNPTNPYTYTPFSQATGVGQYLKFTMSQASPFVWTESANNKYILLRNLIGQGPPPYFKDATAEIQGAVAGAPDLSYALVYGNVDYPGGAPNIDGATPNPKGAQDNFTTWAVYWKTGEATFTPVTDTARNTFGEHNNYLTVADTSNNKKFWFVVAQLPVQRNYPADASAPRRSYDLDAAHAYAAELGKHAFNFMTDSRVSYAVTNMSLVETTFDFTLTNPYCPRVSAVTGRRGGNGLTNAPACSTNADTQTVLTLLPHHYQPVSLGTPSAGAQPVVWNIRDGSDGATDFAPPQGGPFGYWSVRGDLKAILGTQFKTRHLVSNFLAAMPPPDYDSKFTPAQPLVSPGNPAPTLGEFMFWLTDRDFVDSLGGASTVPGKAWGRITWANVNRGMYGTAFDLEYQTRQLGILQSMQQYLGDKVTSTKSYREDLGGDQKWIGTPTDPAWNTNRPGVSMSAALQYNTQQIQSAIGQIFSPTPTVAKNGQAADPNNQNEKPIPEGMINFAYYDTITGMVMTHPGATGLSSESFPAAANLPAYPKLTDSAGTINEGFGTVSNWDDHHYQWGYWLPAAALAAVYDSAWTPQNPAPSAWAGANGVGPGVDALIMDLAYNPDIDTDELRKAGQTFYRDPRMTFAKMNFFDQWYGHGWADGLQARNAGGGLGHNENTQEGSQPFAGIAMWGMATNRKPIADLGLYLYATTTYSYDFYMMDKNLNYKPGGASKFVPVVTAQATTATRGNHSTTYTRGQSYWDYTIHNDDAARPSSGSPKFSQQSTEWANDFGGIPLAWMYISTLPVTPWTLAIGRNRDYMNNWVRAMDAPHFKALIDPASSHTWNNSWMTNMLMAQHLGGVYDNAVPQPPGTPLSPYQWFINQVTATNPTVGDFLPPYFGTWTGRTDGGPALDVGLMPITDVLQFLYATSDEGYGAPDWTINGTVSGDKYVFNAAFTNSRGATTFWAYNPGTDAKGEVVSFYRVGQESAGPVQTLCVPPKQWAVAKPGDGKDVGCPGLRGARRR